MKTKLLLTLILALTSVTFAARYASASDGDTIFARAKMGPSLYSNIPTVSTAMGMGLDLGYRTMGGFGITGVGKVNFHCSGTDSSVPAAQVRTEVKSYFLGLSPGFSIYKGLATMTFGMAVGVFSLSTQVDTFNTASSTASPEITKSKFALMPNFDVEFEIHSGFTANVGMQYLVSFGDSPNPGILSPTIGLGYRY